MITCLEVTEGVVRYEKKVIVVNKKGLFSKETANTKKRKVIKYATPFEN